MTTQWTTPLAQLNDETLLARVTELARRERRVTVALLAHLAELDERRLYLDDGCSSLFTWCTEVLHFSEHAAYNRIECARAARRFPLILDRLADGSVHLTAVRLLSPHLTRDNHRDLLDRARHLAKRQIEELMAEIRPRPDVPSVVRRLPGGGVSPGRGVSPVETRAWTSADLFHPAVQTDPDQAASADPRHAARPAPPTVVAPLAPGRYRVQFTADDEMHRDLQAARDLLRHQVPNGDPAVILKLALKQLVAELHRKKFAATARPRRVPPTSKSTVQPSRVAAPTTTTPSSGPAGRHIPAAVRRAVVARDGQRCAFRGRDGRRCTASGHLEFHHLEPFAVGGPPSVDNIALRCRAHNAHESERCFDSSRGAGVRFAGRAKDGWRDHTGSSIKPAQLVPERVP